MVARQHDPDYDPYVWHDDTVYGMRFCTPDLISAPDAGGDWTSAFILDIDHIVAWVRDGEQVRFLVAPADLMFRNVCDLELAVDWGDADAGMREPSIDHIDRLPVAGVAGAGSLYRWRIVLNQPARGHIEFRADGFELRQRRPAQLRDEQRLPVSGRV